MISRYLNVDKKSILSVAIILLFAAAISWFIISFKVPGSSGGVRYSKQFGAVLGSEKVPSMSMRFFIMGESPTVFEGSHDEKDGQSFNQLVYVTATPRNSLYKEYTEYFEGAHWEITNKLHNEERTFFVVSRTGRQATISLTDATNGLVRGYVTLLEPISSPKPVPQGN